MPRSTNRYLVKSADLSVAKKELLPGRRVIVLASAGSRLGGKEGIILGFGTTPSQVKVQLDGAKSHVTLHVRYVELLQSN